MDSSEVIDFQLCVSRMEGRLRGFSGFRCRVLRVAHGTKVFDQLLGSFVLGWRALRTKTPTAASV